MSAAKTFWKFDAVVTALAVDHNSNHAAIGLGDGTLRLIALDKQIAGKSETIRQHAGPVMALCPGFDGLVSGGDDGTLRLHRAGAASQTLLTRAGAWFEHVLPLADGRIAASCGKRIILIDATGAVQELGPHPSTVAGLSTGHVSAGPLAGRAVLAAAHYGGVSLWTLDAGAKRDYVWKGSHLTVALSPDGAYLASAMQDGEVHAWRLADETDMRMAGYPGKLASISWSADSLLLATAGIDTIPCWPFDGPGPEGRPPYDYGSQGTARVRLVAAHPFLPMIAAGYEDGVVAIVDLPTGRVGRVDVSKRAPVTGLLWSPDGVHLLSGAEDGRVAIFTAPALRDAAPTPQKEPA